MTRLRLAIGCALLVGAAGCNGIHDIGSQDNADTSKCCFDTIAMQKVASCQGLGNCYCAPELCNNGASCQSARDCPQLGIPCQKCADGSIACPVVDCVSGQCKATLNKCPPPMCTSDKDCPQLGVPCHVCPDGTAACYVNQCLNGQCHVTPPAMCSPPPPPVDGGMGMGCVVPQICKSCPDGSASCATAEVVNGMCKVVFPPCPPPMQPCMVDGDCANKLQPICTRCPPDPAGNTQVCGTVFCKQGVCEATAPSCPPKGCTSDMDCPPTPPLGAPCRLCPNNRAACPAIQCVGGQCKLVFPTC